MTQLLLDAGVVGDFAASLQREWLVTNGLGGYAAGTVAGINTRRYHGLLFASLHPPVERTLMVAKLDATVLIDGQRIDLATNEFADGTIAPQGYRQLLSFRLDGTIPVWTYRIGNGLLEQRLWMSHGQNTTYLSFTLLEARTPIQIELVPLCTYRDYHWQLRGSRTLATVALPHGVEIAAHPDAQRYRLLAEQGEYRDARDWYWHFRHRSESERGLDDLEDLYRPGIFTLSLAPGATSAIVMTAENDDPMPARSSLEREQARQKELLATAGRVGTAAYRQLVLAADQYIVERRDAGHMPLGATIIAGYPWFSDWGRDTMIALPGLTLATGRSQLAASVLRTFARFVSEGMLPNRFPDGGETPEYNTVDATLWYFVAIDEYVRATGDMALLRELYPVLQSVIDWHQRGTRYGIRVDDRDGLLRAGEPGVQLTWMDARIGDWVVTPRSGKPVEINALWFNALSITRDFARMLNDSAGTARYAAAATQVAQSFNDRFWNADGGYLHDVVDTPESMTDNSLRPNQLFAVSLRHALVDQQRARSTVDICERYLWTPVGLRSLSPVAVTARDGTGDTRDIRYASRYVGAPHERDAVYHQGTVWSWLLGPFVIAHLRVHSDTAHASRLLSGVIPHLHDGCVGQVSEIFDADAPFAPRGCFAQAWGVAEILRAWSYLDECKSQTREQRTATSAADR